MIPAPAICLGVLREHVRLVHHVPGRVRLRVGPGLLPALGLTPDSAAAFFADLLDGVREVRMSRAAGSVTLRYDPARMQPAAWETLLRGPEDQARAVLETFLTPRQGRN